MIKDKKVLILGAGGFIGSHMVQRLEEDNHVVGVDIEWDNYIEFSGKHKRLTIDLRDKYVCREALKGYDYVFNFAANMGGIGYISSVGADVVYDNSMINLNVINACMTHGIEKLFFSSSACVYPVRGVRPFKEADAIPASPDNFYGWEKLYNEQVLEAFRRDYGMTIRIGRFHNIYGPYGTYDGGREKVPAALCRKIVKSEGNLEIWGDGQQVRSFCYIDDCIDGVIKLMMSDYYWPLNIGSDRAVTIEELADMIIKISGKDINKIFDIYKPMGVRVRNADLHLVKKKIGWSPRVPLETGLKRTYEWIKKVIS